MSILFVTQDVVGLRSGGGVVTGFERGILSSLGEEMFVVDNTVVPAAQDPFDNDERYCDVVMRYVDDRGAPRLAHFYSGCFSATVEFLKSKGTRITYSVDPHDPDLSIDESVRCGISYPFKHISDRNLRALYMKGYVLADVVIVPSAQGAKIMKGYGCSNILVIPHPVGSFPELQFPGRFTVGFFGQAGSDKGIQYLLEAWKILDLRDSSLLFGGDNVGNVMHIWRRKGGRNIELMGPVDNVETFMKRVSVYVQPSVTEGFGIPVLEAMACGRPVIVSEGAGVAETLDSAKAQVGIKIPIRDPKAIAQAVRFYADHPDKILEHGAQARIHSGSFAPEIVGARFLDVWRSGIQ